MRCYLCDKTASALFPILELHGRRDHSVPVTVYVCATCQKERSKQLRGGKE